MSKNHGNEPSRPLRSKFSDNVLAEVYKQKPPKYTLISSIKEYFAMKKRQLTPITGTFVVLAILLVSGTATAALLNWFGTDVRVEESNGVIESSVRDCPDFPPSRHNLTPGKAQGSYSFIEKYEVVNPSFITQEEIQNAQLAVCEQRAIEELVTKQFPDMKEYKQTELLPNSKGLYFPVYHSGIVVSLTPESATFSDVRTQNRGYQSATITIKVDKDALILKDGKPTIVQSFKAGDRVYFTFQNRAVPGETIDRSSIKDLGVKVTEPNERSTIRGISAIDYDYNLIRKFIDARNNGSLKPIQTDPSRG